VGLAKMTWEVEPSDGKKPAKASTPSCFSHTRFISVSQKRSLSTSHDRCHQELPELVNRSQPVAAFCNDR